VGAALGIAFGASVAAAFSWRDAFIAIGVLGLIVAAVTPFLVKEPRRGGLDQAASAAAPARPAKAGFWATVKMFFSNPVLVLASLGSGVTQIVTYGLGNFAVLFLMREKGMTLNDVALWYALVVAIGMGGGIFASGWLIDRYTRRSKKAYALLPAISLALALPFYIAFVWAPSWPLALALMLGPNFLNYFYLSSSVALVQEEVRPNQRVMAGALLLLVMNFIGMGVGPTYVGAASDFFRATHPENSLQIALYTLIPVYLAAIGLFLWLARVLGRDTPRAETVR
jgi:MFS family permease